MGAGESRAPQAANLPVLWSDEAKADFYDAEQWYADINLRLSEKFVEAIEKNIFC